MRGNRTGKDRRAGRMWLLPLAIGFWFVLANVLYYAQFLDQAVRLLSRFAVGGF